MATKRYCQESFYIERPDGTMITFCAWTTSTRNGFCHTVWNPDRDETTKVSYINRTWESYRYQTALKRAFEKLPKSDRDICHLWDVATVNKNHLECEEYVKAFKCVYDNTPQEFKDRLAKSDILLETQDEANTLMGLMMAASLC